MASDCERGSQDKRKREQSQRGKLFHSNEESSFIHTYDGY